jgi:Flp pilus assembly protein TadD
MRARAVESTFNQTLGLIVYYREAGKSRTGVVEREMASYQRRAGKPKFLSPSSLAIAAVLAAALGGCAANRGDVTGSIPVASAKMSEIDWRQRADYLRERYRTSPANAEMAIAYAQALRATGQYSQAAAVLQQASIRNPRHPGVLGAYGRALADLGQYDQALDILSKAHSPDQPDWRILNAQGAVLDQMGNHADAQRYYETALKIAPDEPSILSNLGLSYALSKDLANAETTLKRAADRPNTEPRVRQNLVLVLGLQGKFQEAERIAADDLPPEEARANIAYMREMMKERDPWKTLAATKPTA